MPLRRRPTDPAKVKQALTRKQSTLRQSEADPAIEAARKAVAAAQSAGYAPGQQRQAPTVLLNYNPQPNRHQTGCFQATVTYVPRSSPTSAPLRR